MKLSVCIVGWYFHKHLLEALLTVKDRYPIFVICHKEGDTLGLPKILIDNVGLEFGAYSYYVQRIWKEDHNVLFLHDDTKINARYLFEEVEKIKVDHAFLFSNEIERAYNSGGHGRAMYCSSQFLFHAKESNGFWYDKGNKGFVADGHYTATRPPEGCGHHNAAVHAFMRYLGRVKKDTDMKVGSYLVTPSIINARRGKY